MFKVETTMKDRIVSLKQLNENQVDVCVDGVQVAYFYESSFDHAQVLCVNKSQCDAQGLTIR